MGEIPAQVLNEGGRPSYSQKYNSHYLFRLDDFLQNGKNLHDDLSYQA